MALPIDKNASTNYSADIAKYFDGAGIGDLGLNKVVFDDKIGAAAFEKISPGAWSTSPNIPDFGGDLLAANPTSGDSNAWTFITAPQSVSYSVSAEVQRVDVFGTNTPPVIASSRGMRDLTLTEALMEGFTLGKSVQKNLDDLENLMNVQLDQKEGFVNVPVYNVFAGGKDYGLYIIEQVEVEEQMRDLQGRATRAMVGVSLKQVPKYQVGTGTDQAGASTGGQALDASKFNTEASKQSENIAKSGSTTPAAQAQDVSGVSVPAGATNISSTTLKDGRVQVSYKVNGVTYKKIGK